ncbi:MAG TPA: hypothetical protein VFM15_07970, partial [Gammaproteobacteria bacterium]|nr:hypothetical protein [Gammaproteobacteria bacterium]
EKVRGVPASPQQNGKQVNFSIAIPGHPATFTGKVDDDNANSLTGTFTQDGKSSPLVLVKASNNG